MRFKIDWASLIAGSKLNLPFLLCFTLYLKAIFQVQAPAGGLFVDQFGGIIFGGTYFRNFTVSEECKISKLRWKILWLPYTAVLLSFSVIFPA